MGAPLPGSTAHESDADVDGEPKRELLEAQAAVVTALCQAGLFMPFPRRSEHDTVWCDAHSLAVAASSSGGSHQVLFQRQAGDERMP